MDKKLNTVLVYFTTFILLSTFVVTPLSISNSYWGFAYAEEQLINEQIFDVTNATSTEPITVNATSTEPITVNATSTEPITVNATSTEPITVNATSTEPITVNATSTEPITVNATSTEPITVPEATVSFQFGDLEYVNTNSTIAEPESTTLELSGQGDFLQIANVTAINDLNGLTVTAWVKPDYSSGSPEFTVVSKDKSFSLTINNNISSENTAKFSVFDGIKWNTVESTSIIPENWSFLSSTFDGESIAMFVNGTREATQEVVGVPSLSINGKLKTSIVENITSEEDIVIGATVTSKDGLDKPSNQFSGELDDVLLYDYVLEDLQILGMYEQTKDAYVVLTESALSIEEILDQMIEEQNLNATSTTPIDTGLNSTSTEVQPVNSTSTTPIQPLVELQVTPVLTSTKETYLISEDAVLDLEFYNEYDVLMMELAQLDTAMQLLTIDVNQTLQQTTTSLDIVTTNQTSNSPILSFINVLFFIPEADATKQTDEDASKIEIENTKLEINKLKTQLDALKEDPNLTKEEIKIAKEQLKKVIQQIKLTASQVSKAELKDEGAKLDKSADDIEKIGGVEPEAPIQTDSWVGVYETIVGDVYDSEGGKTALKVNYEKDTRRKVYHQGRV